MSILDLDAVYAVFCSVDTFWRTFEPFWERELLATGRQRRSTPLTCQRDHDHRHPLPSLGLPHLQSVLHAVCPGAVAGGVPAVGQLQPLCRVAPAWPAPAHRLPTYP